MSIGDLELVEHISTENNYIGYKTEQSREYDVIYIYVVKIKYFIRLLFR